MPATNFPEYAHDIADLLDGLISSAQARVRELQIDQRSALRGFIALVLIFDDESELHVREFIDFSLPEPSLMYAYHYQDSNHELIIRYDNAKHRPELEKAEHKHTARAVNVSSMRTLPQVIDEILRGK